MLEVAVDYREHFLWEKLQGLLASSPTPGISWIQSNLTLGDVVIRSQGNTDSDSESGIDQDICILERKTLADLLASIKDGRYDEQSHRLIHASGLPRHRIFYLLEGMLSTCRDKREKGLVVSSMTSLSLYKGFSVWRTIGTMETAEFILGMVCKIQRNTKDKKELYSVVVNVATTTTASDSQDENTHTESSMTQPPPYETVVHRQKKLNITPENMMHILLCQIPSISDVVSGILVQKYENSLPRLITDLTNNPHTLDGLKYTCGGKLRKISSTALTNIRLYLMGPNPGSSVVTVDENVN